MGLWGDGHLRPGDRLAHTGQEVVRQPLKVPRVQVQLALALPGKAGVKGQKGVEILAVGGLLKGPPGGVHGLTDKLLLKHQHLVSLLQLRGGLGPVAEVLGLALAVLQDRTHLLGALFLEALGDLAGLFSGLLKNLFCFLLAVTGYLA